MASRKSRRSSILKTRCDVGPEDLNFDNGDGGGVTRNLTGVINRRRVSFSQTNHVKEFEKSNSSVEGSISETSDFNKTMCDLNMSIQSEDDNAYGQDKTENGNQTRLVVSDMSVYNSNFNETAASCFTEPVASSSFNRKNQSRQSESSNGSPNDTFSKTSDLTKTKYDLNMSISGDEDNGTTDKENGRNDANKTTVEFADMSVYQQDFPNQTMTCRNKEETFVTLHVGHQEKHKASSINTNHSIKTSYGNDIRFEATDMSLCENPSPAVINEAICDVNETRGDLNKTKFGLMDISVYQGHHMDEITSEETKGYDVNKTRFEVADMSLCPIPSPAVITEAICNVNETRGDVNKTKFGLMDISVYQGHHMDELTCEGTKGHDVNKTRFEVADMSVCEQLSNDKLIVERRDDENTEDGKNNRSEVADISIYQGQMDVNDENGEAQNMKIGSAANKTKVGVTDNSLYHTLPAKTADTESGMPAKPLGTGTRLYFAPTNHEQLRDTLGQGKLKAHKRKQDQITQLSFGKFGSAKTPKRNKIQTSIVPENAAKSILKKRHVTQVDVQTSPMFQTLPQTVVAGKAILATKSVSEVQVQTSPMLQAAPKPVIGENSSPMSVVQVPTGDVFLKPTLPDASKEILTQTSLQSQAPSETEVSKKKSVVQTSLMIVETTPASQIQTPPKQRKANSHTCPQVTTTPSIPVSQQAQAPPETAVSKQKSVLHVDSDVTSQTIRVSCVQTPPETAVSRRKPVVHTDLQPRFQTPPAFHVDVETTSKTSKSKKKSNVLTESEGIARFSEDSQAHAPSETEAPKTQVLAPSVSSSEGSVSKIAPFIITDSPVTAPRASVSVSQLQTEETIMLQKKSVASTETDPVKSPIQITSETEVAKKPIVNASPQLQVTAQTSIASLSQIQNPHASVISRSKPIASKDPKQAISQVDTVSGIVVSKKSPVVLTNGQVSAETIPVTQDPTSSSAIATSEKHSTVRTDGQVSTETIPFPLDSTLSPAIATSEKNAAVHTSRKLSIETIPVTQDPTSSSAIATSEKHSTVRTDGQVSTETIPFPLDSTLSPAIATSEKNAAVHTSRKLSIETIPDPQVQASSTEIAIPRKKPIFSIDLQIPAQTQPPPACASQDQVSAAVSNKKPAVHMFSQVISQTFPSSPLHALPDIEVSRTSAFHTDSRFNANCTATESFPDNPMTESPGFIAESICEFTTNTPPSSACKIPFKTPVLNKSILERDAIINNTIVPQTPSMIDTPQQDSITSKSFMRTESSGLVKVQSFQPQQPPSGSTPGFVELKSRLNTYVHASLDVFEKWGFLTKVLDELSKLTENEWQDLLRLTKIREFFGEQYINIVHINRQRLNDPNPLYRNAMRRLEQMKLKGSV